jgi:hypothetical protein
LVKDERKFLKDLQAVVGDKTAFVKSRKEALAAHEKAWDSRFLFTGHLFTCLQHASECKDWIDSLTQERWDELDEIRYKRQTE